MEEQKNKKTKKQKDKGREQELEELLKRVQADFVNYKKRTEEARLTLFKQSTREIILKVLPVLDNLDRAMKHIPKGLESDEWVAGLQNIRDQFENILREEGLEIIETVGKEFDHDKHEAISFIESDKSEGTILEEYEKGYELNGQIIRAAKVVVGKNPN